MYFTEMIARSRKVKDKKKKLNNILLNRGIPGEIIYQRERHMTGWFLFLPNDNVPQFMGQNYCAVEEMINNGILDYVKEWRLK